MEVFNLADYASRGQGMAVNKMKMEELQRAKQKEETLSVLASQHVKEDGSVDLEGLANALPAAGFVQEGLEMQLKAREMKQQEADSEYKHAKESGEAFANLWKNVENPASQFIKSGSPEDLSTLQAAIDQYAPQLDFTLPDDPELAKSQVKAYMPVMAAEGTLHKLTEVAAQYRSLYGDDDPRTHAAIVDLANAQDEIEVKQKKAQAEMAQFSLDYKKKQQDLDYDSEKAILDIQLKKKQLAEEDTNKPPAGYRWGDPDAQGNPTLVPIEGSKAARDRDKDMRKQTSHKNTQSHTLRMIDEMVQLVEENPRSTASLFAPVARAAGAVAGIFNPEGEANPAISFRQKRDSILGIAKDLFNDDRLSNQQMEKIETSLGGNTVTTPENTIEALNIVKEAINGPGSNDTQDEMPTIQSDADYEKLPSGTVFIAPDGTKRKKP